MGTRGAWLGLGDAIGKYLKAREEPACFILGAGASISSGAPSTAKVDSVLNEAYGWRDSEPHSEDSPPPSNPYYEANEDFSVKEKTSYLDPLFKNATPHVGYRCLASLARQRRIMIVNLNWDGLVAEACYRMGIRCFSFDLGNAAKREDALAAISNDDYRVICVHAHGRLEENPRRRRRETLEFGDDEKKLLDDHFLRLATIVVGASLTQDLDVDDIVRGLLGRASTESSDEPSWWFLRQTSGRLGGRWGGGHHLCENPHVDFDRLMVRIAATVNERSVKHFESAYPGLKVPPDEHLVVPRPEVMRELMNSEAAVLAGPPRLGKTTAASLAAYWRFVYEPDLLSATEEEGPVGCSGGLAPDELKPHEIRLLDAPFGTTDEFEENPSFVSGLRNLAQALEAKAAAEPVRHTPKLIVTTRSGNWARATVSSDTRELHVLPSRAADWYAKEDLLEILEDPELTTESRAKLTYAIREGEITTPAQVMFALTTRGRRNVTEKTYKEEFLLDRKMTLESHPEVARLAVHVRLQSFSHHLTDADALVRQAGVGPEGKRVAAVMLSRASLDDFEYWTLAHSQDTEAVDQFIAAQGTRLESFLTPPNGLASWVREALKVFNAQKAAQVEGVQMLNKELLPPHLLREWAPDFLAATADPQMLVITPLRTLDRWGRNEMVHELVRLWEKFARDSEVEREMDGLLAAGNPMGIYAILQASLYVGPGVNVEVWDRVRAALWDIARALRASGDPSDEDARGAALVFDALLWRCPNESARSAKSWANQIASDTGPNDPILGAMMFSGSYHFDGAKDLLEKQTLKDLEAGSINPAQAAFAAWMMEWHFLHLSRAWAFLARRSFKGKDYLARSLAGRPPVQPLAGRRVEQLVRAMTNASRETAGWAFHLALHAHWNIAPMSSAAMTNALHRAQDADPGIVSAALTYEFPNVVAQHLQNYFAEAPNKTALLDAMSRGIEVCGQPAAPPRFCFNRNPFSIQRRLDIEWRNLNRFFSRGRGIEEFVGKLGGLAEELVSEQPNLDRQALAEIKSAAERGDLREIEAAASARPTTPGERDEKALLLRTVEMHSGPDLLS